MKTEWLQHNFVGNAVMQAAFIAHNIFYHPAFSTIPNDPRDLSGLAISQGNLVSAFESGRPAVLISRSNSVSFATTAPGTYTNTWTAVAGSDLVLINGQPQLASCSTSFCGPNPRTAVGLSQDSHYLYLVVIDGRQPGWSDGATLNETGQWLLRLGAWNGLNLDGGGSSAMARSTNGTAVLLNRPSGGVQRVNGNHLGVFALPYGISPAIVGQPQSQTVVAGQTVTFSATATGTAPQTFCWRWGGTDLPGATNSSYTITNAQIAGSGAYSVVVSNAYGFAISSNALLTVLPLAALGDNTFAQLSVPVGASNLVAVAAGAWHSLALGADGVPVAWGENSDGQCDVPNDLTNALAIAAGGYHSLAIRGEGNVMAWGANDYQQCAVPTDLDAAISVAAGTWHSLALQRNGAVIGWGDNAFGQVTAPVKLRAAVAIAAGGNHSLALQADGTVLAWGENTDASGIASGQSIVPAGLSNVVAIAAGDYHSLALKADGTVAAWGDNTEGQCDLPAGLTNVAAIAGGGAHSLALRADGTVLAWGSHWAGQCNLPPGLAGVMGIAAGAEHSLLLAEAALPVPRLHAPAYRAGSFGVLIQTLNRRFYSLESVASLAETNWSAAASVPGSGALRALTDTNATPARRFYRVRQSVNAGGSSP